MRYPRGTAMLHTYEIDKQQKHIVFNIRRQNKIKSNMFKRKSHFRKMLRFLRICTHEMYGKHKEPEAGWCLLTASLQQDGLSLHMPSNAAWK